MKVSGSSNSNFEIYSTSGSLKWAVGMRDCAVIVVTFLTIVPLVYDVVKEFAKNFFNRGDAPLSKALKKSLKKGYNASEEIGDEAVSRLHYAALTLRCCQAVSKRKVDLNEIYDAAEIEKAYKKGLSKEKRKHFKSELTKERGRQLPAKLTHEFTASNHKIREKTVSLDASLGAKYLAVAGSYEKEIKYIKSHKHGANWGQRCSEAREGEELQGMVINGRTHTISVDGKKVEEIYRSGAFAVHGKGKKSIKYRKDMTVAQALPKVCQAIKSMVLDKKSMEIVRKTGSFLHVEQSLLSDLDGKELGMIQDMKGALDHIREKARVQFGGEEKVEIDKKGNILITLKVENPPQGTFGIHTVFFTQGVNEHQSSGFAFCRNLYQEKYNLEGLGHLLAYAKAAGKEVKPLKSHFAKGNIRWAKDLAGIDVIRETVKTLGGRRGVVCKSAKDRTGFECSHALAKAVAKVVGHESEVYDKLVRGISLTLTGHNTGKRKGYAFNILQRRALPWDVPGWICSSFVKS